MELGCNRQSVTINEIIFNGCVEQGIESDIILADYCPDVVRILKCVVLPKIEAAQVNGSHMTVDGAACVKVFYLTEQKKIHCHPFSVPFQKNIELKESCTDCVVNVFPKVDYANCRAVSSRRIDFKGALTLQIKAICCCKEEMVCEAQEMGVQLRRETCSCNQLIGQASSRFTVQETLELSYGKPSLVTLVDCRSAAAATNCKPIGGKVITKGELHLQFTYYCPDNKLQFMEYSLPISQICDIEGVTEDSECQVSYEIISCGVQPQPNPDGEVRNLKLECDIRCTVYAHRREETIQVSDCYSTQYECSSSSQKTTAANLLRMVEETYQFKESITVPDSISAIGDLWCSLEDLIIEQAQEKIRLNIKLNICLLAYDNEEEPELFDRTEELVYEVDAGALKEDLVFLPEVQAIDSSYSIQGSDRMEIRCELLIQGCIYSMEQRLLLKGIEVDTNRPKETGDRSPLTLYYADKGESVWEIAKRYNTIPDSIMEENELQQDCLDSRRMLLIPIL